MVRSSRTSSENQQKSLDKKPVKAHPKVKWDDIHVLLLFLLVKELRKRHGIGLPGDIFHICLPL